MAQTKYKKIFEEIWNKDKELFQKFVLLNNDYDDPDRREELEEEFQKIGGKVKDMLQEGENELCRQMEKSEKRVFSSNVAEKYWDEVRKYFKYIDMVGVVTRRK